MAMNFAKTYPTHEETLARFMTRFNNVLYEGCDLEFYNLCMLRLRKDSYKNDGTFVQIDADKCCGYDWQCRHTGYDTLGAFEYAKWGLGQYNTKLVKPSIKISLQISRDETGLLVAWHSDYEKVVDVKLSSETKKNRTEKVGNTYFFTEFDIRTDEGVLAFKKMIYDAIREQKFDHTIFATSQ